MLEGSGLCSNWEENNENNRIALLRIPATQWLLVY